MGLTISFLSRSAAILVITQNYTFPQLMQLTSRFHFLASVALGLPGSDTKPGPFKFSKYLQFQCSNCALRLFWRWCAACPHALLLGTNLKKTSGGFKFDAKVVRRKIPSRVGLCKKGKEKAKEYCHLGKPRLRLCSLQICAQLPRSR
jgi:hypothetical protein